MREFSIINVLSLVAVLILLVASPLVGAQEARNLTCWMWGGSENAAQGQFMRCEASIVTVVKTEVREVKVPVPVPGPVRVERVEVPAPAPAPKIRN